MREQKSETRIERPGETKRDKERPESESRRVVSRCQGYCYWHSGTHLHIVYMMSPSQFPVSAALSTRPSLSLGLNHTVHLLSCNVCCLLLPYLIVSLCLSVSICLSDLSIFIFIITPATVPIKGLLPLLH